MLLTIWTVLAGGLLVLEPIRGVGTDWSAFGGGAAETVLGRGVLVLMLLGILLIVSIPRRFVMVPLMFGVFLLPVGQTLVFGGLHLYVSRVLILVGLIRMVVSRQPREPLLSFGYGRLDRVFTIWSIYHASAFSLVHKEMGAVVNQFGFLSDALGGYLLMRMLIRNDEDVRRAIKVLSAVAATLAVTLAYEKLTQVNVYGFLTGYPILPEIREGSVRAQGPFHHAILAGTFGATLFPLFLWLWRSKRSRGLGAVGMVASTVIPCCAASSTPVAAYAAGVFAICLWPLRKSMRLLRWGIVIALLSMHLTMHAPVWWVLAHIDLAGGSAGHHRAELVDNFVGHISDWWLIGTKDYGSWGFLMKDISNQYVAEGEVGGLVSFVCIITVITMSFKRIGLARRLSQGDQKEWYFWLLGAALFAHTAAFLGIGYFDQTKHEWYALLAMIIAATGVAFEERVPHRPNDRSRRPLDAKCEEAVLAATPGKLMEARTP